MICILILRHWYSARLQQPYNSIERLSTVWVKVLMKLWLIKKLKKKTKLKRYALPCCSSTFSRGQAIFKIKTMSLWGQHLRASKDTLDPLTVTFSIDLLALISTLSIPEQKDVSPIHPAESDISLFTTFPCTSNHCLHQTICMVFTSLLTCLHRIINEVQTVWEPQGLWKGTVSLYTELPITSHLCTRTKSMPPTLHVIFPLCSSHLRSFPSVDRLSAHSIAHSACLVSDYPKTVIA